MKTILANDYLNWTLRTVVGLALIVAAIDKASDPSAFAAAVANYRIVPDGLVVVLASILPWIELLTGLSILFGALHRGASLLAAGLFTVFILAMVSALARGLDIACGCFTQDPEVGMISWIRILENSGLLLASLLIALSDNMSFSIEEYIRRRPSGT